MSAPPGSSAVNPVDDYRSRPICRPYRPPGPPNVWGGMAQAALAGLLAAQALPPAHWWGLLFAALGWLLWLLEQHLKWMDTSARRARRAAALLFAYGLGWHGWGISWVAEAFFVDAERFAMLAPLAVALLAAAMAAFYAAAGALAALFWPLGHCWRAPLLALFMTLADAARGVPLAFGGFAWNPFAVVLDADYMLGLMQGVHLLGVWGFSALLLWLVMLPAQLWLCRRAGVPVSRLRALAALGVLLAAGLWIWGQMRVMRIAAAPVAKDAPWLIIVQPSVAQREKWRPQNRQRIFEDLLRLSRQGLTKVREKCAADDSCAAPVVVIWPESAVPFLLDVSPRALAMIGDMLPAGGWLLTGALRQTQAYTRGKVKDGPRLHNSVLAIDASGQVRLAYDKRRLVPFGEYVPFEKLLKPLGVGKLVPFRHGFQPGRELGPHYLPGLPPFEAFICYEIIYHDRPARAHDTRWLLNVTNDAWFGTSAGPYQHLQHARLHAIARGLPLARAANSGISAVLDAAGRSRGHLPLQYRGTLVVRLPVQPQGTEIFP